MSQFEDNKKKIFAEQLRCLMSEYEKSNGKKLTQAELAEQIPVARETISYWLSGKSYPGSDALERLRDIFALPRNYFSNQSYDDGWTLIDKQSHDNLQREAEETARNIGLSPGLFAFIKESPALADAVVSASWVDGTIQSLSPDVPELPDHTYQIKASSGVKIYPPADVLYMLRVVQRDLSEYALFLIKKWSKVIDDTIKDAQRRGELSDTDCGCFDASGNEFVSAVDRYWLELKGRGSLTPGSSLIVDMYEKSKPEGQSAIIKASRNVFHEYRKKDPDAQRVRKAVRKAIKTNTPVPPLDTILNDKTED